MKTREFVIKTKNLEIEYDDSLTVDLIQEYVFEELEVPAEYIESMSVTSNRVNIKLSKEKRYFNDDWYVNLQRVA